MRAADWIDRIDAINDRLELLDKEAENMSERELCLDVILKNIPRKWGKDFTLLGGDKANTLDQSKKISKTIKRACERSKDDGREPSNNNPKPEPKTTPSVDMCHLKGHNHPWKDYENNPHSKNYNGTHFAVICKQERKNTPASKDDARASVSEEEASYKKRKDAKKFTVLIPDILMR